MKPWKSTLSKGAKASASTLQWGHGDEAVEEEKARAAKGTMEEASMGPRR